MPTYINGMSATDLPRDVEWHKAARSNPQGNCVELAVLPGGNVGVRNSRYPHGVVLVFTRPELQAFVLGAKDGDFDKLV